MRNGIWNEVWVQDEKIQIFKVLSARDFFIK